MNNQSQSPRRGIAVLLVLLMLSLVLGLSYAMVRSQNAAAHVQYNANGRASARQAAMTGMLMAIKKMQSSTWAGVGTTLTGTLSANQSFSVTYATGDPSLSSGSSNYLDYPFRVTLLSTGTASNPADLTSPAAQHQIQAVMHLIPRQLTTEPTNWSNVAGKTIYQSQPGTFNISVPFRAVGSVWCVSQMNLPQGYPWSSTTNQKYLTDLNSMRLAGQTDWRPFNGPISLPFNNQQNGFTTLLSSNMGISLTNNQTWNSSIQYPGNKTLASYCIYPGGTSYPIAALPSSCSNQSFLPDPIRNPLGLFVAQGSVSLYQNVTVQGSLITSGDVQLYGPNVTVAPLSLPPLYGSTQPVRLPIVMAHNFTLRPGASGSLDGLVASQGNFEIQSDAQSDIQMTLQINVVTQGFLIDPRSDWVQSGGWWNSLYSLFQNQGSHPIQYFPNYLQAVTTLNPAPQLTIQADPAPAYYTWNNLQNNLQNAKNSLFVPGATDSGCLRWDLLQWTDFP